jgi:hypothetical protein
MSFAKRESIVGQTCGLTFIRKHKISRVANPFYSLSQVHGVRVVGIAESTISGGTSGCVNLY